MSITVSITPWNKKSFYSLTNDKIIVGKAISQFCHCSKYDSAALLQERLADNFHKKCDNAVAIEEYQRASKLYCAAKMTDQSDQTLEKAAHLLGDIEKYREF